MSAIPAVTSTVSPPHTDTGIHIGKPKKLIPNHHRITRIPEAVIIRAGVLKFSTLLSKNR